MDGGAWWAAVHGVAKSRTRLSDFTLNFHFPALEKEMATRSSILAWRIPGMAEPGLLTTGLHRFGHDWSDLAAVGGRQVAWWERKTCCTQKGRTEIRWRAHSFSEDTPLKLKVSCLDVPSDICLWHLSRCCLEKKNLGWWIGTHGFLWKATSIMKAKDDAVLEIGWQKK